MPLNKLQRLTIFIVGQTSKLVANFSLFLLHSGVVTMTMFFLFRDGDRLLSRVKEAMPLARERTEMHTLVLFIFILGGLKVFGLLGLVIGPVLATIFISFFDFYLTEISRARTTEMPASSGPE